jgi:hypothetical protein
MCMFTYLFTYSIKTYLLFSNLSIWFMNHVFCFSNKHPIKHTTISRHLVTSSCFIQISFFVLKKINWKAGLYEQLAHTATHCLFLSKRKGFFFFFFSNLKQRATCHLGIVTWHSSTEKDFCFLCKTDSLQFTDNPVLKYVRLPPFWGQSKGKEWDHGVGKKIVLPFSK